VLGGEDVMTAEARDDVWEFDFASTTWRQVQSRLPQPLFHSAATVLPSTGSTGSGVLQSLNRSPLLSAQPASQPPQRLTQVVSDTVKLLIFGGNQANGFPSAETLIYDTGVPIPPPAAAQDPDMGSHTPAIPLPDPWSLVSVDTPALWDQAGSDFVSHTVSPTRVTASGQHGRFEPQQTGDGDRWDASAYALYRFDLEGTESGRLLDTIWETPPKDNDFWVGLANFEDQRWDWYDAAPGTALTVPELLPYTADSQEVYVVIVVTGAGPAELAHLAFVGAAPVARLTIDPDPAVGEAPVTVALDASGSTSPNGAIVAYEWDFDGDGAFGINPDEQAADQDSAPQYTRDVDWSSPVAVRITDELGLRARAKVPLAVYVVLTGLDDLEHGKYIHTEAYGLFVGVPFQGAHTGALVVYRATDAARKDFQAPIVLDDTAWVTGFDARMVEGNPAVAYSAAGAPMELRYLRANNAAANDWPAVATVLHRASTVNSPVLEIVGGKPALAFSLDEGFDAYTYLGYVAARDAIGEAWASMVQAQQPPPGSGRIAYYSLAEVEGHPALAYDYYQPNPAPGIESLRYVRALDSAGSAWGAPVDVVTNTSVWSFVHLSGAPNIGYDTVVAPELFQMLVYAEDTIGATWGAAVDVSESDAQATDTAVLKIASARIMAPFGREGNPELVPRWAPDIEGVRDLRAMHSVDRSWSTSVELSESGTRATDTAASRTASAGKTELFGRYDATYKVDGQEYRGMFFFERNKGTGKSRMKYRIQDFRKGSPNNPFIWDIGSFLGPWDFPAGSSPIIENVTLLFDKGVMTGKSYLRIEVQYRDGPGQPIKKAITGALVGNYYVTDGLYSNEITLYKPPEVRSSKNHY